MCDSPGKSPRGCLTTLGRPKDGPASDSEATISDDEFFGYDSEPDEAAARAHSELDCRAGEARADGPTRSAGNVFAEQASNILKELDL